MKSNVRDSSLDYRTYWLQGGQYYSRRGLGSTDAVCTLPADKLAQIPEADRKILIDEVNADPAFCAKVARAMATLPDWGHQIAASAKEAIANEMDPSKFRNRAGMWPKLRARAQALVEAVSTAMAQGKVPVSATPRLSGLGDLGQWDIIASLVGSVVTAGANVYGATVTANAQQTIARQQAQAAMQAAQANIAMSNAATAMQSANAAMNPISSVLAPVSTALQTLATGSIAGIPLLAFPAVGLIIYFANKKN
jgi:hypothetical protein